MNTKLLFAFAVALNILSTPIAAHAGLFDGIISTIDGAIDGMNKRNAQEKIKLLNEVQDRKLVDAFYVLSEDASKALVAPEFKDKFSSIEINRLTLSSLTISYNMYKADNMSDMVATMNSYTYSVTDDLFGQKYIALAQSRGNIVKLYKTKMGGLINQMFQQNFTFTTTSNFRNWLDLDNALIEYSPDGQIFSFMTRSHQASIGFGVIGRQYVNLYFGKENSRILENKISNNEFENNFLRVVSAPVKKDESSFPAVQNPVEPTQPTQAVTETEKTTISEQQNSVIPAPSGVEVLIQPGKPDALMLRQDENLVPITPKNQMPNIKSESAQRLQLLIQLGELRRSGVLNEQEFNTEKQRILGN